MKTNSTGTMKTAFIIARVMSAIFVGFSLFMLIGEAIEGVHKVNPEPVTMNAAIQLILFVIGLLGLLLAWKWKIAGGVISLVAFVVLFIIDIDSIVWIIIIFPANALLFVLIGIGSIDAEINNH